MRRSLVLSILLAISLIACTAPEPPVPTSSPAPTLTATATGPSELTICSGAEPDSLYLYGDSSPIANSIREAIYEGLFDAVNGESQPAIFTQTPSLENGGLRLEAVPVQAGDLVVDDKGNLGPLYETLMVRPAGCRSGDCALAYDGGELLMDQMVLNYELLPGITWADGRPLTANDSVFSFRTASDPATPGDKTHIRHTAGYQALDERSLEWRGLPGYLDADYLQNFWPPLPEHRLGSLSTEELVSAEAATRTALGYGAYTVESWSAGESLTLSRNPHYFGVDDENETLPFFERLIIRFTGSAPQSNLQALMDGDCDLLLPSTGIEAESAQITELVEGGQVQAHYGEGSAWWHLDFGIQPFAYDDGINLFSERPDFFSTPEVRQALALCLDRQALVDDFAFGQGDLPASYLSPNHALANPDATTYTFDPQAGSALLEAAGWLPGEDGIRSAQAVETVLFDTQLSLRLHTANDQTSLAIAQNIRNSLDDCGIDIEIVSESPEAVFAPGPEGPLFGRDFDLALFAWPQSQQAACYLYQSEAIPGPDPTVYPFAWGGWNLSGWSHAEFDAACDAALSALPGEGAYAKSHAHAQAIFAEELPALPLFISQQIVLSRTDFCGFDFSSGEALANIESFGFAEWCQ